MTNSIAFLAQDLLNKINSADALNGNIGMATGGGPIDPSMQQVPLPSAWLLFQSETNLNPDVKGWNQSDVTRTYSVLVVIPYKDQPDLINIQLPLLETIRSAVSGQIVSGPTDALRWKYDGMTLLEVSNDRLIYEQKFMVSGQVLTTN